MQLQGTHALLATSGWGLSGILFIVAAYLMYRDSGEHYFIGSYTENVAKLVALLFIGIAVFDIWMCVKFAH